MRPSVLTYISLVSVSALFNPQNRFGELDYDYNQDKEYRQQLTKDDPQAYYEQEHYPLYNPDEEYEYNPQEEYEPDSIPEDEDQYNLEDEEYEDEDTDLEFPFVVKITGDKVCAGSLYKEDLILTTASCAQGEPDSYSVGIYDTESPSGFPSTYAVTHVVVHPKYAVDPRAYDLAILRIDTSVYYPQSTETEIAREHQSTIPGEKLIVTTWDVDFDSKSDSYKLNNELNSFNIMIQNATACGTLISQLHPHLEFCAGYDDNIGGLLSFHVGSPSYLQTHNSTTLVGIFAKTDSRYNGFVPGEFTRISQFTKWIDNTVALLHQDD